MIGHVVSHYRIEEKLGEGGMGVVYKAEDLKLKRAVALKFLSPSLTHDALAIERFEREAQAAAALNHPNIVTIYDVGRFEDRTYFCMEYVDGEELSEALERATISIEKAIDITEQTCAALGKAHRAGIVHRDIKPANVIVDREGTVKVLDFGLAKLRGASGLTKDTSTVGTLEYMSPEQIKGGEVDHRTDIWSLGVLLYRMVAGAAPWKGDYEQAIAYAIVNEPHPRLSESNPAVPGRLEEVVERSLAKDPDDRYQSVREMLNHLDQALQGATVPAVDPSITMADQPITGAPTLVDRDLSKAPLAEDASPELDVGADRVVLRERIVRRVKRRRTRGGQQRDRDETRNECSIHHRSRLRTRTVSAEAGVQSTIRAIRACGKRSGLL